ncbi:hypothetical protein INH39_01050 [Massilia violaceinigra]|uniref:Type II secretion system protein GspG C-terminal domain-containing protein n=1 Tax=Massilia violaceinigra TaxID=2045208 RepID=A0ABY4A6H8_9BURK|nr:hypothetical protein [Massilia violaceinigra]UOD30377.1 hypothetical protein INH39_01050 [Massilia violaceinigra]
MLPAYTPPAAKRRYAAIALTLLAHALLVLGWQYARRLPPVDNDPGHSMQWVKIMPPMATAPPPKPVSQPVARPAARADAPAARPVPATPAAPVAPISEAPPDTIVQDAPPVAPNAAEIMRQARRSIGKIDQDLRKAHPGQPISAPVSNGATRLAQGLQAAADAAPNRWYEAPKVTEIIDPGQYDRRRYRVVGADGTYCITVESNHAPDGLDISSKGIQHKKTNCEKNEQAATKQKW